MKAIAFSPAHVTGFFEICYDENDKETGSRGAGICISLGSYAEAEIYGGGDINIEGNIGKGEVTKEALENLGVKGLKIRIKNELPFSQGFGISASSTLAARGKEKNWLGGCCYIIYRGTGNKKGAWH